ncbi:MAG TPA: hypothetical protein VHU89_19005 [Acidobacteriaceae bacterium]|nr:hypothetical protein [Acidobacteriaceae bacterium]
MDDRIVIGHFSDGADAYRAINELVDEGFGASEIGAAFRGSRAGAEGIEGSGSMGIREITETNPALSGSIGGAASHDEAVTPAGLAPGSGNAFPAPPSSPGPIPGGEIPSTLRHDLPHDLPMRPQETGAPERLRPVSSGTSRSSSNLKFGTGEGHLGLEEVHPYSESAFEGSFLGMGLGPQEARSLSGELSRGGAVVSVRAKDRAALAEGILERNHGRVRWETASDSGREADQESPVQVYGSMRGHYRPEDGLRRRAS